MKTKFIKLLQKRIANTSIGPSTARKMGPKGTIQKAREYLIKLKLSEFQVKTEEKFLKKLNYHTNKLKKSSILGKFSKIHQHLSARVSLQ